MQRIGVINSGGDVSGMNTVLEALGKYSYENGIALLGFHEGWNGLLNNQYINLNLDTVRGISAQGGTILETTNTGPFAGKTGKGEVNQIEEDILDKAKANFQNLELDALIVMGGDGTLTAALQLFNHGVPLVAIPKTIDNDVQGTEKSFGFSSAVNVATEAIDRLHTTANSHDRVMIVETMGRHAGWLALHSGLAGNADAILLPEFPYHYQDLVKALKEKREAGKDYAIVVAAEGAVAADEELSYDQNKDWEKREIKISGCAARVQEKLNEIAADEFDIRHVVLGHTQRGGTPSSEDRILSRNYAAAAMDALQKEEFGNMVALEGGKIVSKKLTDCIAELNLVPQDSTELQTAKELGIFIN